MISHENYMERIVDFYDGKLSQSESDALMAFLKVNSELYEEFVVYGENFPEMASNEHPKAPVALREQLKNIPDNVFVLTDELLVAYAENDLDAATIRKVEMAIARDSDRQRDLKIMTAARFEPDSSIEFPYKNALRKKETVAFRSMFYYASAAIAAIFILAFFLWPENAPNAGQQSGKITFANLTFEKELAVDSTEKSATGFTYSHANYSNSPQLAINNTTEVRSYENMAPLAPRVAGQLKENKTGTTARIDDARNEYLAIYEMIEYKNSMQQPDENKTGTLTAWKDWGKGMLTGESSVKDTPASITLRDVTEFSKTNLNRIATESLSLSQRD